MGRHPKREEGYNRKTLSPKIPPQKTKRVGQWVVYNEKTSFPNFWKARKREKRTFTGKQMWNPRQLWEGKKRPHNE